MPQVNYRDLGKLGLSLDKDPAELPVGFFTGGYNFIPSLNGIKSAPGYQDSGLQVGGEPEFLLAENNNGADKIHVFCNANTYIANGTGAVETTHLSGLTPAIKWSAIYHKEVVFATNGTNALQFFNEGTGKFETDPAWPAGLLVSVIRNYKDYLIGLKLIDNGNASNEEVIWSHPTIVGQTPASWDVTNAIYDAGRIPFPTAQGVVVDGLELGDDFIVYKTDSVWKLTFVGGTKIFRRAKITGEMGLLGTGAVASTPKGHFMITTSGFYLYKGGQSFDPIGHGRVSEGFLQDLDSDNYDKAFILVKKDFREVWVYYPSIGSEYCDKALVWNWELDSWGLVHVNNVLHACTSNNISIGDSKTWEDTTFAWTADGRWYSQLLRRYISTIYEAQWAQSTVENLKHQTVLGDREGVIPPMVLERRDCLLGPFSARGNVIQDYETVKIISEMWVRIQANGLVNIFVGGRDNESEDVVWEDPVLFNPAVEEKLDVFLSWRYHAVRIENVDATALNVQGFNIRWENAGEF